MTSTTRPIDAPGEVDLVAELRRLSTADRLVDVSAVPGPTTHRCEGLLLRCDQPAPVHVALEEDLLRCDQPAPVHVVLEEDVGLRTWHFEHDLCPGCALVVIGRTSADYVDVEVRIPAIGGAE